MAASSRLSASVSPPMTNRFLVFVLLVGIFVGPKLHACSCAKIRSAGELIKRAPVAFEGIVVRKQPRLLKSEFGWYVGDEWTFRILSGWKGVKDKTVTVMEGYGNCTNIYQLGEQAIVFAYPHETSRGRLEASKCATPVQPPDLQRAELGKPEVSYPGGTFEPEGFVRRAVRHATVYLLAGIAIVRDGVRDSRSWQQSVVSGPVVALLAACALGAIALFGLRRRRRFVATVLAVAALLLLVTTLGAGYRMVNANPYFWHLVEKECSPC